MPDDDLLAGTTIDSGTLMVPSGRPGPQGMPAWSPVAEDFEVPTIGATVEIELENANWVTEGAVIYIGPGVWGRVTQLLDGKRIIIQRLNDDPARGVADGSDAATGMIGEYLESAFTDVDLPDVTWTDIGWLTLTPGDWDVWVNAGFTPDAPGTPTNMTLALRAAPAGEPGAERRAGISVADLSGTSASAGPLRFSASADMTAYACAYVSSGDTAITVSGIVTARRMR